jgi:Fe-S-cluster containining protein
VLDELARTLTANAARSGSLDRFAKLSAKLHLLADQEILKMQGETQPCACRPGCAHCCRTLATATLPELIEIVAKVRTWHESRREAVLARIGAYQIEAASHWKGEQLAFRAECPFLDGERCSIYELRPLHCRSKSSFSAEVCRNELDDPEIEIPGVPEQAEVCARIVEGTLAGFQDAARPAGTYELAPSVHHFLQDQPGLPRRFEVKSARKSDVGLRSDLKAIRLQAESSYEEHAAGVPAASTSRPLSQLFDLELPVVYSSLDQAEACWDALNTGLDRLIETRLEPVLAFHGLMYASLFFLPYATRDVKPFLKRFMEHAHREFACKAFPQFTAPLPAKRKPGPFRLGYLSTRLVGYNGSRWALGWLGNHGPEFETYAFNVSPVEDAISLRWRRLADHYFRLPVGAAEAAELIRSLDLDALVFTDAGEDGLTVQLSLMRLARWQCGGWGRVVTSGSPQIDLYLSAEEMEPADGDSHYTERLVRLPGSGQFLYPEPVKPSQKPREALGVPDRPFLFVGQNPCKLHPSRDALYREITERTGKPIVICSHPSNQEAGEVVCSRMSRAGVDVHLLPRASMADFMRVARLADAVLDSFDFSGGMTTIQILSAGIPLLTRPGPFMRGRMAIPFLRQVGAGDLIASTDREFVELICDANRIAAAAEKLEPERLFRDLRPVRALEQVLLGLPG